jgi:NADH-quinone oxidoreductase subunit N
MFPEVFLATSILILTVYASFCATTKTKPLVLQSTNKLGLISLGLTILLIYNSDHELSNIYQNTFVIDFYSSTIKVITLAFTGLCLWLNQKNLDRLKINNFEYILLVLSASLGLLFLVSSNDLISLYLALEMQSLCLYVLAAAKKDSTFSTEAGLKYFILGSLSSALLLFGISMLYGLTGTTNFSNFSLLFSGDLDEISCLLSIKHALMMIIVAFFFKVAAAPFHMWSPDVYEGAPTSSTIFFAVVPKIALFGVFSRLFFNVFYLFYDVYVFASIIVALASVLVGSFGALKQKKIKRLLAYSSISHVGYMLLGFASNSSEGLQAIFFYLVIYMITNISLWEILVSIEFSNKTDRARTLTDLVSVSKNNPALGLGGLIALFSMTGIPPLAGFSAKMFVFSTALNSSLYIVTILAILMSVISSYYYLRLIKNLYFENLTNDSFVHPLTLPSAYIISTATILLIVLFFNPSFLYLVTYKMVLCFS